MNCPNCGYALGEGKWLCENCGSEAHIVPEFDPLLEGELSPEPPREVEPGEEKRRESLPWMAALAILLGLMAAISLFALWWGLGLRPQALGSGQQYLTEGEFAQAAAAFEREWASGDREALWGWAQAAQALGDTKTARTRLEAYLAQDGQAAHLELALLMLASLYAQEGQARSVADLLEKYDLDSLHEAYAAYKPSVVESNMPEGIYQGSQTLILHAAMGAQILYTLDGTDPLVSGSLYEAPILLEPGVYRLHALAKSQGGVEGPLLQAELTLEAQEEFFLSALPEEGMYAQPQWIVLEGGPGEIHYTLDGSQPGLESPVYGQPFPMPLGGSFLSAVLIGPDGEPARDLTVKYVLEPDTDLTSDTAAGMMVESMMASGRIYDREGHFDAQDDRRLVYVFLHLAEVQGQNFWVFQEQMAQDGQRTATGGIYGVSDGEGICYALTQGADGRYTPGQPLP